MENKDVRDDEVIIIVDTAQIQAYIFNSNRLRENIGASGLVRLATEDWARDAAKGLPVSEIYAGGGNYVAQAKRSVAQQFARKLSKQVLSEAPELQFVIGLHAINATKGNLYDNVQDAFAGLAQQKQTRAPSTPLLGLGVSVMCQSTGLPAVGLTQIINGDATSRYPASAGIIAKRKQLGKTKERLQTGEAFKDILGSVFAFPSDFDELGRSHGDQSVIAIVHADGNGMGDRIRVIGKGKPDEEYKREIKAFSDALEQATINALRDVVRSLVLSIQTRIYSADEGKPRMEHVIRHVMVSDAPPKQADWVNDADDRLITEIVLQDVPADKNDALRKLNYTDEDFEIPFKFEQNRVFLPFVPIVVGGDDVTFVCDGRLGLSLAKLFVERFNHYTSDLPDRKGSATACAGVAIVKTHYPFARAYQLAESLCQSAKDRRKLLMQGKKVDYSVLDWHYALSGLSGGIKEIRQREYTARWNDTVKGSLVQRPLVIGADPENVLFEWATLEKAIIAFQHEEWLSRRNKLKALREVLRQGPASVSRFLTLYGIKSLPEICDPPAELSTTGWQKKTEKADGNQDREEVHVWTCGYFDAIELADLYVPINLKEAPAPAQLKEQVPA